MATQPASPARSPGAKQEPNASAAQPGWSHAPGTLTLLWLAISLPLVAWDTAYVLLRPRSMPGGSLHWPLWAPYALYGEIDHMYGRKQWALGNGFPAAQALMNAAETAIAAVMTVSKTVLYWLNEYCSGFDNIGHNRPVTLFFPWIIPK
ncbi:hypothetical protein BT67DRAFT_433376 [Trichocladium antarcticum]|uniref:Uncharacterized protein n=1 Tax=Trichocladium antarcticum TaxID=1450529 RepID=A0AAN6ULI1_9PEZI|nr:hypothetical protein BT67DRAFT_433376 [Trichocladium antarcticum]